MPTIDIEKRIDSVLEQQRTARDEEARATVREQVIEQERIAQLAKQQADERAARAAYLGRVAATYSKVCADYKAATDTWRDARTKLQALDTVLGRQGFSTHHLGIELRHSTAAPDEGDLHYGYAAAENSLRKTLGG